MITSHTPSHARAHLFELISQVNQVREPVAITPANGKPGAVLVAAEDWASISETLYLEATGTMDVVRKRLTDQSGTSEASHIDWDDL